MKTLRGEKLQRWTVLRALPTFVLMIRDDNTGMGRCGWGTGAAGVERFGFGATATVTPKSHYSATGSDEIICS